eukprot:CAMPEP_0196715738 /NCGR_PEP_ID=MMETSP1090-20130531/76363_1 /TAXON_ID=37098 /ORGANISM="Isochrysis sp, Strain CCMP1244" /LENGTH=59 /DNA_ID=CAMNT_0042055843 /DNA_START=375 /DNA_END=554 /DNA_ORIENTATION=-
MRRRGAVTARPTTKAAPGMSSPPGSAPSEKAILMPSSRIASASALVDAGRAPSSRPCRT